MNQLVTMPPGSAHAATRPKSREQRASHGSPKSAAAGVQESIARFDAVAALRAVAAAGHGSPQPHSTPPAYASAPADASLPSTAPAAAAHLGSNAPAPRMRSAPRRQAAVPLLAAAAAGVSCAAGADAPAPVAAPAPAIVLEAHAVAPDHVADAGAAAHAGAAAAPPEAAPAPSQRVPLQLSRRSKGRISIHLARLFRLYLTEEDFNKYGRGKTTHVETREELSAIFGVRREDNSSGRARKIFVRLGACKLVNAVLHHLQRGRQARAEALAMDA